MQLFFAPQMRAYKIDISRSYHCDIRFLAFLNERLFF